MNPPSSVAVALGGEFEACYKDLVRFLAHRTGCAEQARELAHDTWLRLAAAVTPAADIRHAKAYVFGVAQHLAIDRSRRELSRARQQGEAALRSAAASPDVADQLAHRQALRAVDQVLQALPVRARDVFLAHRLDGVDHDTLALQHGVSRSTIERDVQRAQVRVQAAIERWHGRCDAAPPAVARRRSLLALLGLAAGGPPLLWSLWRTQVPQWQQVLAAPVGQLARYRLPDGSELTLDADSSIEARYFGASRELRLLRGAAHFAVVHSPGRPFSVRAAGTVSTVLGTRFAVDMTGRGASAMVAVVVESGRVRVDPGAGRAGRELSAGQGWRIAAEGPVEDPVAVTPDAVAPWRQGRLSFSRMPLGQVVEQLARHSERPLQVRGAAAALPVSGELRIARADEWLRLLPEALPVQVRREADGGIVIAPR